MLSLKRRIFFLSFVFFVSCLFALPGPSLSAEPKPGDVINAGNVDQYKDYLPLLIKGYVKDGWGLEKPVNIHVTSPTKITVPQTYIEASKKNVEKVTLNPDGTLNGFVSGLPFPDPKEPNLGQKILWNHYYRWRADNFTYDQGFWTTARRKGGTITKSLAMIDILFFSHRTAVDPKPNLPSKANLYFALILDSQTPPNKDLATLTWRYDDPRKNDDMWSYVPTLRRTIRLMSSERANPVRGTAYTWDDFYGFDGRILDYNAKFVGKKQFLALMNQQTKAVKGSKFETGYPHPVVAGPTDPYELHGFYQVDVFPKNPRHPETKKSLFISDKIWHVIYSHVYNKKGNLWKGCNNAIINIKTSMDADGWTQCSSALSDFKTGYWSQNLLWEVTMDGPMDMDKFTPAALGMY